MTVTDIRGEGVRLRGLAPADLDDLLAGYADPLVRRYLPGLPTTREQVERRLGKAGGDLVAIADPGTDRLLGTIALTHVRPERGRGEQPERGQSELPERGQSELPEPGRGEQPERGRGEQPERGQGELPERGQSELECWVGPWARRRGVATAAVRALTGHALDRGLARIELLARWENIAGQRLALAAGFAREGVRRGAAPGGDDLIAYARLPGDPAGPVERLLPDLPGGELTDGVVTVRPLVAGDLDFYAELHSLADVVATSVPPVAPSREQLVRRCGRAPAEWLAGGRADMVIVDAATGAPAGDIGLYYDEPRTGQAMIGYSMLPGWRGRGFPTRAVQLVTLWAFAETGIARLVAGALPSNLGSHRVLEKAGFKREAYLRSRLPGDGGRRNDDVQFVLLAEDLLTEMARLDG